MLINVAVLGESVIFTFSAKGIKLHSINRERGVKTRCA
jgi:hypothetical protein